MVVTIYDLAREAGVSISTVSKALSDSYTISEKTKRHVLETARRRSVTKEVVPDVRALLFWLKNRRPERWRERRDAEEKAPEFDFDSTDEQL